LVNNAFDAVASGNGTHRWVTLSADCTNGQQRLDGNPVVISELGAELDYFLEVYAPWKKSMNLYIVRLIELIAADRYSRPSWFRSCLDSRNGSPGVFL
jgi:hypothetical protein